MADAQRVTAEIKRLSQVGDDAFVKTVVAYVMGASDNRVPRDVQGAALEDPRLAARTLEALETAIKQAKSFNPRRDGESKREQQARIVPWRERIKAATGPFQDVVDDLAHEHAKKLAALDDEAFTGRWAAFILDEPVPAPTAPRVEALALRSPRVAARGAELCKLMFEEPSRFLPTDPGESRTARERRVDLFRRRVQSEARFLRYALQYAEARQGRMPSEPNIRLQALRLLGQAHPEELSKLRHQVRGEGRAAGAAVRRDRRDLRRAGQGAR
ncbi:hypothetical protein ACFQ6U_13595 [Streptomyces sp. NPDC056465]|uniref:hypothetical protein n=1 Tax=unclassified Streptomyces TaxID=2593676 RepID=UPI0035DAD791